MKTPPKRSKELPTIAALIELETKLPILLHQRDELRAALEAIVTCPGIEYVAPVFVEQARAALAETQPEAKP